MFRALTSSTLFGIAAAGYSLDTTVHIKLVDACSQAPNVSHLGVLLGRGYGVFYVGNTQDNFDNCQDVTDVGPVTVWTGEHSGCVDVPLSLVLFSNTANTYDAEVDETELSVTMTCYENGVFVNETSVVNWSFSGCVMGNDGPIIAPGGTCTATSS